MHISLTLKIAQYCKTEMNTREKIHPIFRHIDIKISIFLFGFKIEAGKKN